MSLQSEYEDMEYSICKKCGAKYLEYSIFPYPIYGTAKGFKQVKVTIGKQSQTRETNKEGEWVIDLANFPHYKRIYKKVYKNCHDYSWELKTRKIVVEGMEPQPMKEKINSEDGAITVTL